MTEAMIDRDIDYIEELNSTFSKNLHTSLKQRINASIYVNVDHNGDLVVSINKGRMGWSSTIPEIMMKLACGLTSDKLVDYITKQYRKSVLNNYFY